MPPRPATAPANADPGDTRGSLESKLLTDPAHLPGLEVFKVKPSRAAGETNRSTNGITTR